MKLKSFEEMFDDVWRDAGYSGRAERAATTRTELLKALAQYKLAEAIENFNKSCF